jgi:hypothetical protein
MQALHLNKRSTGMQGDICITRTTPTRTQCQQRIEGGRMREALGEEEVVQWSCHTVQETRRRTSHQTETRVLQTKQGQETRKLRM